jgi:hypothetical protein
VYKLFELDLTKLLAVLLHHPLVVLGRDSRQPLREEVIERVTGLHFDDFTLTAKVLDVVDQEQSITAVGPLGQTLVGNLL